MVNSDNSSLTHPINIYDILAKLHNVKNAGTNKWTANCPCPGHSTPEKHLAIEDTGDKALVTCFPKGPHDYKQICNALGFDSLSYSKKSNKTDHKSIKNPAITYKLVEQYIYELEKGVEYYVIERKVSDILGDDGKPLKKFSIKHKENGKYVYNQGNLKTILYHIPEVRQWVRSGQAIRIPEGERKADALIKLELTATSSTFGAGSNKWSDEYSKDLVDAEVYIYPDNDEVGEQFALEKAQRLYGKAKVIKIVRFPGLPDKGDIIDWFKMGHTREELLKIETETPFYEPPKNLHLDITADKYKFNLTDLGNAERLIERHGENLHYSYERKKWLFWNGKFWDWVDDGKVVTLAGDTIRALYIEAASIADKDERNTLIKHAMRSESGSRLTAMITLSQSLFGITIKVSQLDTHQGLLNVNNGTIDLKTGRLEPHNSSNLVTAVIPLDYDPEAHSELWNKFLQDIFAGRESVRDYIQTAK